MMQPSPSRISTGTWPPAKRSRTPLWMAIRKLRCRHLLPAFVYDSLSYRWYAELFRRSVLLQPFIGLQGKFQRGFERFREAYGRLLAAVLYHRGAFALLFLAFCAGSMLLVFLLGQDFFPAVDAGQFRLHVRA